ncbi:Kinesin motor domain [Carpediemonas membranifera]|uniref:Kinesin-like protein n=1 Tax=Carpediemonas membranifera TaxID=201153 RepID=A0A8J6E1C2_9EUKA|nr:Kinesin motor domain [Carpediemonas membranifera]|eukprot:KAG9392876.1 Kinesin motor domain [Carpediemonas membranifera]
MPKRGNIQVAVRLRPTAAFSEALSVTDAGVTVNLGHSKSDSSSFLDNQQKVYTFNFDRVMKDAPQQDVYESCARPTVESVVSGFNGTVFCYGQTGAGKTYTMTGDTSMSYLQRGVVPRAIIDLFRLLNERPGTIATVRVSYLEIYNEQLYDLLSPNEMTGHLQIQDDSSGNTVVRGLTMPVCATEEECMHYLFQGDTTRVIAEHQMNNASSRSHCIFTIHVEQRHNTSVAEKVVTSKLHLVDLAGSERVTKTKSDGKILQEANYINKSLTFLEQVVVALSTKNRDHIPYRQSKLTNVLRDSLGGNSKTSMIANIHGETAHLDETVSTLRFAERVMCVNNHAVVNESMDPVMMVKKLEREVRELKQELAMHDAIANRAGVNYGTLSDDQIFDIRQQVRKYMAGESDDIEIVSVGQIKEVFRQFKSLAGTVTDPSGTIDDQDHAQEMTSGAGKPTAAASRPSTSGVGNVTATSGFSVGLSAIASSASPVKTKPKIVPRVVQEQDKDAEPAPSKEEGFERFCAGEGAVMSASVSENKAELARKKADRRSLANEVNEAKSRIDTLTEHLAERSRTHPAEEDEAKGIVDAEASQMTDELKAAKNAYRAAYDRLREVTAEVKAIQTLGNRAKAQLLASFEEWYASSFPNAGEELEDDGPCVPVEGNPFDEARKTVTRNTLQMVAKRRIMSRKREL